MKIYKISKTWQVTLICSSIALFVTIFLPAFSVSQPEDASNLILGACIAGGISGLFSFILISAKYITSPSHIASELLWISTKTTWNNIEKIEIDPRGMLNMTCKEPLYNNSIANAIAKLLGCDRTFQIGLSTLDKPSVRSLFADIENYVKNCPTPRIEENIP